MGQNLLSLYALQAIQSLAPFIVLPYLARTLGPPGYGALALFQSLIAYGTIVLDFGFYVSAIRDSARWRDDPERLGSRFKVIMAAKATLLFVIVLFMLVAAAAVPSVRGEAGLFFACGLQLVGNIVIPVWLFQGLESAQKIVIPQIIARLTTTALIFLLVHDRSDTALAALLLSASDVLCGVLLWRRVREAIVLDGAGVSCRDVVALLREDLPLFAISIGGNLYSAFNPLLIEIFYGHTEVAYYAVSLRVATVISKVTGPLVQAVSPRLARLVVENVDEARRLLLRSAMVLGGMTAASGALMVLFAPEILGLVGGGSFVSATNVLRTLAPLAFLIVMGSLVGQNYAVHLGFGRRIAWIYWVVGVASLTIMIPLTRAYGAVGSSAAVILAEVIVVSGICVLAARRMPGMETGRVRAP